MNVFGGGFTAPPNSQCKLRQAQGTPQQQFTNPVRQLGVLPVTPPFGVTPPPGPMQPNLGVVPGPVVQNGQGPNVQGFARPVAPPQVQPQSPVGPQSYKVMKKGEAPCPVCRG